MISNIIQKNKEVNRIPNIAISLALIFSTFFAIFTTNENVSADSSIITTAEELSDMRNNLAGNYELGSDIDLADLDWEGIGGPFNDEEFTGSFDGKGYTISNLTSTYNDTGLFNYVKGSTIKNVTFTNVDIDKNHSSNTAAVVSGANGALIENVTVENGVIQGGGNVSAIVGNAGTSEVKIINSHTIDVTIIAGTHTGGHAGSLVANGTNTIIENSSATNTEGSDKGKVTSGNRNVGGLAGLAGTVKNSFSTVDVVSTYSYDTNPANVGGLVGHIYPGGIVDSYATGNVTAARANAGGLVGLARGGSGAQIKNSYATGHVDGRNNVGGLVGYHDSFRGHEIHDSYATGEVKGQTNVGGLIGLQANERADRSDFESMLISKSYSESSVQASGEGTNVGGLIGKIEKNDLSRIEDAYARGSVTGKVNVGGLIGLNEEATIDRAYATGAVLGDSNTGGLIGNDDNGAYSASAPNFYDNETTGMSDSTGATGESTANMKVRPTFVGWNFTTIWKFTKDHTVDDYPVFRDEPFDAVTDVDPGYWGRDDVTEIIEEGIMQGSQDPNNPDKSLFRPADNITRAEFAIVIINALNVNIINTAEADVSTASTGFNDDNQIPNWARDEVAKARELGIVEGDDNGNFNPSNRISRAEIAAMIARAYDLEAEGFGGPAFADHDQIPDWAAESIDLVVAFGIMQGRDGNRFAPGAQAQRIEAGLSALRAYKLD